MRGLESAALCVQLVGEILVCIQENLPNFLLAEFLYIIYVPHGSIMLHVYWDRQIDECAFLFEVVSLSVLALGSDMLR